METFIALFYLFLLPLRRCLIKDFELRPNVLDLLQHVFIKQIVGRERTLQKQLIELIDLNQQIGVVGKIRYCPISNMSTSCAKGEYSPCTVKSLTAPKNLEVGKSLPVSGSSLLACGLAFAGSIIQITPIC